MRIICVLLSLLCVALTAQAQAPVITKLGTIECDLVEATPLVFKGKLYRFEYVRDRYKPNTTGDSYFRFVDTASGETTPSFARGFHLGSAFTVNDTMYVYGVPLWGEDSIHVFWSTNLEDWQEQVAFQEDGWGIYNTAVAEGPDGHVMAIEIGEPPEEVGTRFTIRFAASKDLLNWRATSTNQVYSREKYTACPALRYLDGQYYMVYLESYPGSWAPHIVRSPDLVEWETSPLNPMMKHSDEDRVPVNPQFTTEELERLKTAKNVNNSDVDFCEFNGKTVIYYSWGDQHGTEHLAAAEFDGPEEAFLKVFFPQSAETNP